LEWYQKKHGLQSFFTRWWREQTEATKDLVRKLVDNGQLDFVNGGYVQHDEAAAHYVAMIDQTTRGHRYQKQLYSSCTCSAMQCAMMHSPSHAQLVNQLTDRESSNRMWP